jgi:hypothetical protein
VGEHDRKIAARMSRRDRPYDDLGLNQSTRIYFLGAKSFLRRVNEEAGDLQGFSRFLL